MCCRELNAFVWSPPRFLQTKYAAINTAGSLKGVTYVVRTAASGGQPPKSCTKAGDKLVVPYTSAITIYGTQPAGAGGRKMLAAAA